MRLAFHHLTPITPAHARLPMKTATHSAMDCRSCHQPTQKSNPLFASQQSCIQCHDDEHTNNNRNSKHFNVGVTCATCHMPNEKRNGSIFVIHDNTVNLRPNEKMIKNVCIDCHGLQFSMDAMTTPSLLDNNFSAPPTETHPGIKWTSDAALKRGGEDAKDIRAILEALGKKSPTTTKNDHQ
jgi:hypothetical protein